nr:immunoglobulin heavy chain junction region [Mus musculus]
CARDDVYFDYW